MLVEILEKKNDFTNSEIQIADYILKNPFELVHMTANELGEKTYTSKASVFRLCKKLGIDSYQDFKRQIELEINEKNRLHALLMEEPFHQKSSLEDVINILPSFYDTAISNTKLLFDKNALNRIITVLKQSSKIDIYGAGITSSCANAAMFKFLSIGKECAVHTTSNEHYVMAVKEKKVVAILLSFTGDSAGMIRIAKYLRKLGIYIVGIGGLPSTQLQKLCNEYIEVYQKTLVMSLEMLAPYMSMTYILDTLFAALLIKDFDSHLQDAIEVIKLTM